MAELEWERSLLIKTNFLLDEYRKIVAEFFPGIATLDEFADAFSTTFQDYQHVSAKKLDPDSIRERKISCSSAGALLGVWWVNQFPQLMPIFLIEDLRGMQIAQTTSHVNVVLPLTSQISAREAVIAFNRRGDLYSENVAIIDWTQHSKMKPSNPEKEYSVYSVDGLHAYIKDRLKHLGLSPKYSSKHIQQMLTGTSAQTGTRN